MDLKTLPVSGRYRHASVETPAVPPHTDQVSFGVTVYGKGTVITDDYSMVDSTVKASPAACSAGAACTRGAWQVLPFPSPARAIHAVLMYTGNVLLVAGSATTRPPSPRARSCRRCTTRLGHVQGDPDA